MNNKPAIHIENICRNFGSGELLEKVLRDISLTIDSGEFVGLMGKSGAGKSTLFYQISLLDIPTSGSVTLMGQNADNFTEEERTDFRLEHLGYIFQDYALVPELSAEENVALPLTMLGYDTDKASETAQDTLSRLGLSEKFNNLPSQLSGGQQQRVSIARAIAKKPAILFADEPTANLDNKSSDEVIEALKVLHDKGQTIMMVTHEHEYTKYCTRVLWMEDGVISNEMDPYKEN